MGDGFREGHDRGKQDAEQGQDRNIKPPLIKAVVKGKDYTETYVEGYKEGYRQGKKGD